MDRVTYKDGTAVAPHQTLLAARLSFAAGAASLFCLAILHVLSPEFDTSWRMVSEYALGNFGWVLSLMFVTQALSCVALFFAIKSQVRTVGGRIGLFFLLAAGVGMAMASVFDVTHNLHGLSALIGIPGISIAELILGVSLSRNPAWSSKRRLLLWTANLPWISLVLMVIMLFIGLSQSGGTFGPGVLIGWPNRLLIVAYCGWLMLIAWQINQLYRQKS